jgi:hypothetical protein
MQFYNKIDKFGNYIRVYKKPIYVRSKKVRSKTLAQSWADDLKRLLK